MSSVMLRLRAGLQAHLEEKPDGTEELYFYGISAQKLGTFWVYGGTFFGEEVQVTAQDRDKFAKYYRMGRLGWITRRIGIMPTHSAGS